MDQFHVGKVATNYLASSWVKVRDHFRYVLIISDPLTVSISFLGAFPKAVKRIALPLIASLLFHLHIS